MQKIEFLSLEQGQSKTIPGRRDVAPRRPHSRTAARRRPPPRRSSPRAASRGRPSPSHAPTEAASESCPLLAPRADRPANAQRTDGPFYASPCCSLLPRPHTLPGMSWMVLWSLTGSLVTHIRGTAPPVQAKPRSSRRRRHY
jgi:hypothetical protein